MSEKNRDELRQFVVTPLQTNCYAYVSAGSASWWTRADRARPWRSNLSDVRVICVAATHGHGDHVGGAAALCRATGAPFALHAADAELARHAGEMSEVGRSYDENAPAPDRTLVEGDVISVGTATFAVMETPGHTPGGIVLVGGGTAEGVAFVGDTLFPGSHGRTDLVGGDERAILASLRRMAAEITPETMLLCGHGPATSMAVELARNPFLR